MSKEDYCPVGECDRMKVVEEELFDRETGIKATINKIVLKMENVVTKADVTSTFRFYLGVFITLAIICVSSFIMTWARASQIPEITKQLKSVEDTGRLNEKCDIKQDAQIDALAERLKENNEINTKILHNVEKLATFFEATNKK